MHRGLGGVLLPKGNKPATFEVTLAKGLEFTLMLIDLLVVLIWAVGTYLSKKIFIDLFAPLSIYVSTWCASLLLFRFRLIEYVDLEPKTWLLLTIGMISFCSGCLLCGIRFSVTQSQICKVPDQVCHG